VIGETDADTKRHSVAKHATQQQQMANDVFFLERLQHSRFFEDSGSLSASSG